MIVRYETDHGMRVIRLLLSGRMFLSRNTRIRTGSKFSGGGDKAFVGLAHSLWPVCCNEFIGYEYRVLSIEVEHYIW